MNEKLKAIDKENKIWFIYIGIIFLSWYANSIEKKYVLFKNKEDRIKYQNIMIFIFSILLIIYFEFLKDSYKEYKNININDSSKKQFLITLSLIASLLLFISGLIFLYIAIADENIDTELAFN